MNMYKIFLGSSYHYFYDKVYEQISGAAYLPHFTSEENFKIHFHKAIFQAVDMSLILFALAGAIQNLESLEEQKL